MEPFELLKKAHRVLRDGDFKYAVAGGLAANFFRSQPRITNDVDFLLLVDPVHKTKEKAIEILQTLGFSPNVAKISDLSQGPSMNKKQSPAAIVVGRISNQPKESGVDFLLPGIPWVEKAVMRAQDHLIDYGFARIPTVTPEDFIISKVFALTNKSRYKDLDDLQSIFESDTQMDLPYLVAEFERHHLSLPREMESIAPKSLRRVSKAQRSHAFKS